MPSESASFIAALRSEFMRRHNDRAGARPPPRCGAGVLSTPNPSTRGRDSSVMRQARRTCAIEMFDGALAVAQQDNVRTEVERKIANGGGRPVFTIAIRMYSAARRDAPCARLAIESLARI
jgi:hypothetical protein